MFTLNKNILPSLNRPLLLIVFVSVAIFFVSILSSLPVTAQTPQEDCTGSGGTWAYNGSTLSCSCPSGSQLEGSTCKSPADLCADSGGTWAYNGSTLSCSCPSGLQLEGNTCSEPSSAGAGSASSEPGDGWTNFNTTETGNDCNGVQVSIGVACEEGVNPIFSYITAIINFLSAGVGVVVVLMVAVGGVQYMTAGGNPQATQAAIQRISNALIALVVFLFIWAFLNWLIPGGTLNPGENANAGTGLTNETQHTAELGLYNQLI